MKTLRKTSVTLLYPLFLGSMLFWLPGALHAQINTDELGKGQGQVEFQNYTGPVSRVDTRSQIRNIGYPLGTAVRAGASRSGGDNRYFVIHASSGPDGNKLNADILGLGPSAGVDHIRNLRLIIQGYLEGAYNYSAQDAALLAEYITIYNAVFRGNWTYFNTTYKTGVLQYLTPEKAGLATRFSDWPGKTLMLIPLGNSSAGSLSAIDTSSLSGPEVIDKMREDDGAGIDQRTALADLKDREAGEADEAARRQREAIAAEEARIAAEQAALAAEQARIAREREAAGKAGQTAADLAAQDAAARKRAQELADQAQALEAQRKAAQDAEDFAARKRAEAAADRQEIAQDKGETGQPAGGAQDPGGPGQQGAGSVAAAQPDTAAPGGGAQNTTNAGANQQAQAGAGSGAGGDQQGGYIVSEGGQALGIVGLAIAGSNSPIGYIVKVHPSTGQELQRSPLDSVNVRTVVFINNKIFAVAGKNQGNDPIRMVEINPDTLTVMNQGNDNIHSQSLIWVKGANLYAIVSSGGGLYLARFDTTLTIQAQSTIALHPYAAVNFQGDMLIITQRTNGSTLLLDPTDLTEGR